MRIAIRERRAIRLLVRVLVSLMVLPMLIAGAAAAAAGRQAVALDTGWRFLRADVAAASQEKFDDRHWANVTLPHTFNGADGDDGGGYFRGSAWYRREIALRPLAAGRRLFLQFDGAALVADVWMNGHKIGEHRGGHAAFRFDVTDAVQPGRNVLAVRVDNTAYPDVTPLGGDFTVFGGLYRRVWLIEAAAQHVDLMDYGSAGVMVHTDALSAAAARLRVTARVRNDASVPADAVVRTDVVDAGGKTVASTRRPIRLAPEATVALDTPLSVGAPHRWNGRADPYLYHVVTTVLVGDDPVDAVTVPLGLRTIAFDGARGFLLNGRPYALHGVGLFNSERPGRGTAVTDGEARDDVDTLADMGATSLRLVHFQHPQATYDEADRLGLTLWTEVGVNGAIDPSPAFTANVAGQLRELIRQNANHPSVILWGIGNEIYASGPPVLALLEAEQQVAHAEDPSRPTVYAHCCQSDDDPRTRIPDMIGFNRYFGWYGGQGGSMADWAQRYHAAHPGKPFIVSEYGAGASIRDQEDPPKDHPTDGPFHPEQKQTLYHEQNWRALRDAPGLAASYIWVGFDLASDGRHEGDRPGINDKGLVSYDRLIRKDAFFWYRANWSDEPTLYITSRRLDRRDEAAAEVKVFANRGPVTLTLNGREVGTLALVDHVARWAVTLQPGVNHVSVTAPDKSGGDGTGQGSAGRLSDRVDWLLAPQPDALVQGTMPAQ